MQLNLSSVAIIATAFILVTLNSGYVTCDYDHFEGTQNDAVESPRFDAVESPRINVAEGAQKNAVDLVSTIGVHMVIPYFQRNFDPIAIQPFASKMTEVAVELMEYLDGMIATMLSKKMRSRDWREVMRSIQAITAKLPQEGVDFAHQIGFYRYMLELTKEMLKDSSWLEGRMWDAGVGVNFSQLKDEVHSYFQSNIEAFKASPVSLYFGWAEATMDGEPARDVAVHWMAKVRLSGYSMLMTIAWHLLNVAIAWNKISG